MYLEIDHADDPKAHLMESDVFTSLSVRVPLATSISELTGVLKATGWGYLVKPDKVAVNVSRLRTESAGDDAEAGAAFDKMMAYATSKGWVIDEYRSVEAHIERR